MSMRLLFLYVIGLSLFYSIHSNKPLTLISSISSEIGYISDLSTLSNKKCFKPNEIKNSELTEINHMDTPLRFYELINKLNLENYFNSYHYALESDYFSTFLNYIKDNDFSFSLTYFSILSKNIQSTYVPGTNILSEIGLEEYQKNTQPSFRLICGDKLIRSFQVGFGLFFSIKIHFTNSNDKIKYLINVFNTYETLDKIIQQIEYHYRKFQTKGYLVIYGIQMNSKDNFLNSKVKGFVLCKSSSLFHISVECKDWVNFMSNYFHSDFSIDIKQSIAQSTLFQLEPLLNFEIGESVSSYIELNQHSPYITSQITQKRIEFVNMVNKYKYLLNRLNHIFELDAYKPAEVPTHKGSINTFLNSLISKDKVINCIFDIDHSEQCLQDIIDSGRTIDVEIEEFLQRFNELKHYSINLTDKYCLPSLLSWESLKAIDLNFYINKQFKPITYLSTNEGDEISCSRVNDNSTHYSFNCSENIIPMQFYLEKGVDENQNKRKLTCRNEYLNYEEEVNVTLAIKTHPLGFNISDWESKT